MNFCFIKYRILKKIVQQKNYFRVPKMFQDVSWIYVKNDKLKIHFKQNMYTRTAPIALIYETRCAVWYHSKACNFRRSNTPPWVFFTLFKLYKC